MQNGSKLHESRRQAQKKEIVIFKNYKEHGLELSQHIMWRCVLIKKSMFLIQKLQSFKITPQGLLIN